MKTSWFPSLYFLLDSIFGLVAGFFALLAVLWPDWLESFGVRWDYGDGALEWAVPVVMTLIAVVFSVKAGRLWRIEFAKLVRARA
jgi:hypothetical protein